MKKNCSIYTKLFSISLLVIVLDQLSKYIVRSNLQLREVWIPFDWAKNFFRIIHWKNTGVAFGLFQEKGWIFTVIGLIVLLAVIFLFDQVRLGPAFWRVALGMQLGGAIGNLIDRINPNVGYVVDFIWIGNFPVFNLADSAIVIGAIVLIVGMWISDKKDKKREETVSVNQE